MANIEIKVGKGYDTQTYQKVVLHNGKPLEIKPKTYKEIAVLRHTIGNDYNSNSITIYKAKKATGSGSKYRYSIYRDGCFYPYYGVLTVVNGTTINT